MAVLIHQLASNFLWEDTFFREVAYERGEETNATSEKGVQRIKSTNLRQMCTVVTSYQEAKSGLQDILQFSRDKGQYENCK